MTSIGLYLILVENIQTSALYENELINNEVPNTYIKKKVKSMNVSAAHVAFVR